MPASRASVVVLVLLTPACRLASQRSETLVGSYRGATETVEVTLDLRADGTAWYLELPIGWEFQGGWPRATWSVHSPEPGVEFVTFQPGDGDRRRQVTFAVETAAGVKSLVRYDGTRLNRTQ